MWDVKKTDLSKGEIMKNRGKTRLIGLALLLSGTLVGGTALAGPLVVVPNSNTNTEGTGSANAPNSRFPFDLGQTLVDSARYQQVYAASAFGALARPENITQIVFRPDGTPANANAFSTTLPDVQINLSTTSADPDGLSNTFADNVGSDDTVVSQGALSLSSQYSGPFGGPKDFDIVIDLPHHFQYDPSQGNLLLEVRNFGGGTPVDETTTPFDLQSTLGDSISRVGTGLNGAGGTADSTDATFADTGGLVTQFSFAVPEPSELLVFGFGLAMLSVFGYKRRRV
jgi:hypothetical protein